MGDNLYAPYKPFKKLPYDNKLPFQAPKLPKRWQFYEGNATSGRI